MFIALLFGALALSCGKGIHVESVILNKDVLLLSPGNTALLMATIYPCNATNQNLIWESSNPLVASVNNVGAITAFTEGVAMITVSTEGRNKTASCKIQVLSMAPLRIVHLCDPHLKFINETEINVANLQKSVSIVNEINPDLVVLPGDFVHVISEEIISTFQNTIRQINAPLLLSPGNHDIEKPISREGLLNYRTLLGDDYSVVEFKQFCFISANSMFWWDNECALLDEINTHDQWFKNSLQTAQSKGQLIVILTHIPPFVSNVEEGSNYLNLPITKRKELLNLCEQNGVFLWMAGHTHKPIQCMYNNQINILCGESISENFDGYPPGFRLLNIYPEKVLVGNLFL